LEKGSFDPQTDDPLYAKYEDKVKREGYVIKTKFSEYEAILKIQCSLVFAGFWSTVAKYMHKPLNLY
jgi:hypothetical protein